MPHSSKSLAWTTLACLLLGSSAAAQADRVHLLSNLDEHDEYNDVWGYRSPEGREVAIIGSLFGTAFIETTDPTAPVELAFISRTGSIWGDSRTFGEYAYIVTEGGGGLQIVDLRNLDAISLVKSDSRFFATAHNIAIDTDTGIAYIPGANTGLPILDLADPENPALITNYTAHYVHDMHVQNGYAHLAEIYNGAYRILDVSNLPSLPSLDAITTPGAFTHNVWPSEDDSLAVTTDEVVGGKLGIYDISDKTDIRPAGEYQENPAGIIHNGFVKDGVAHISYYAEGYVAVDLSDPTRPVKLGSYDTYAGTSGSYDGAWGCYPYQPSGVIYLSDRYTGLYVLALAGRIAHDPLPDTLDEAGPYSAAASITPTAGGSVSGPALHYSTDGGQSFSQLTMTATGTPDEYSADIPGLPYGTTVHYYLTAHDGRGDIRHPSVAEDREVFSVGPRTRHLFSDFEASGDEGWTHGSSVGGDDWQRGAPAGKVGDPAFAFSGKKVWGNDIGNSGNGAYPSNSSNWLRSPTLDLGAARGTRLRVERWLTVEDSQYDQATIAVNGVEVWRNPTNGNDLHLLDPGWVTFDIDISTEADGVAATQVEFTLSSDSGLEFGGWNLDDFELYCVESCHAPENYGTGTPGTGGITPTITSAGGPPHLGNAAFQVLGADALGAVPGFLFVGFGRGQTGTKGIDLLIDLGLPFLLFPVAASGSPGVAGDGSVTFPAPLPDNPAAAGIEVDFQFVFFDPGGPQGLSASDGLSITLCD